MRAEALFMRNNNPKKPIMNITEANPLLRYNDGEDFSAWQTTSLEKLEELLGLEFFSQCEDKLQIISATDCGDYTDTYFLFQSEPDYFVPCHILKPKSYTGKLTPLLCLQGHTTGMHISIGVAKYECDKEDIEAGDRDYARIGVRRGYCTIAIEQRYMGECGGTDTGTGCQRHPHHTINVLPSLLYGRTAIGERVHDAMRAIDVISNSKYELFNDLDIGNIMLTGNSGGGTTTFYTACVDKRIKVAIPSCCFCTYKDSIVNIDHCACNYIPSVARYFDMGDLAGLIAPRRLILVSGKDDKIFPLEGVKEAYSIAEKMYKAIDAENNISLIVGYAGHRYYANEVFTKINTMSEK